MIGKTQERNYKGKRLFDEINNTKTSLEGLHSKKQDTYSNSETTASSSPSDIAAKEDFTIVAALNSQLSGKDTTLQQANASLQDKKLEKDQEITRLKKTISKLHSASTALKKVYKSSKNENIMVRRGGVVSKISVMMMTSETTRGEPFVW